jgi:hypothetical protein
MRQQRLAGVLRKAPPIAVATMSPHLAIIIPFATWVPVNVTSGDCRVHPPCVRIYVRSFILEHTSHMYLRFLNTLWAHI